MGIWNNRTVPVSQQKNVTMKDNVKNCDLQFVVTLNLKLLRREKKDTEYVLPASSW